SRLLALTAVMFAVKVALYFAFGWRYSYFPFFAQLCYFTLGMWLYFHRENLTWSRQTAVVMVLVATAIILLLGQASFEFGKFGRHVVFIATLAIITPTAFQHIRG